MIIQCSGGAQPNPTTAKVPAVDITVNYGTAITSRQNPVTAAGTTTIYSDAALVIDDPNSTATPLVSIVGPPAILYGPGAPLTPCTTITAAGSSTPACNTYLLPQTVGGVTYYVSDSTSSTVPTATAANVYQGIITGGGQAVTFYGVPVAAPITTGVYRRFRVVNVRVAPGSSTISGAVTVTGPNASVMSISGGNTATVGTGQTGFAYAMTNSAGNVAASTIAQCITPGLPSAPGNQPQYSPYVALLKFTPNFNNAAKPQGGIGVAAAGATTYGTYTNESEAILGVAASLATTTSTGSNGNNAAIPGAADAGTRFKAVFAGLPYSSTKGAQPLIYASLYNVSNFYTDASGSTSAGAAQATGSNYATLTAGATVASAGAPGTEFDAFAAAPVAFSLAYYNAANGAVTQNPQLVQLAVASNGTATAVWEVQKASKSTAYTFGIYIQYGTATASLSNATVTLSAAPVQPATQPSPANLVQIPSVTTSPTASALLNIVPCQTALLFPFVTTAKETSTIHYETGMAIANTGADPWFSVAVPATVPATSTCTLTFYGTGVATGASTLTPPSVTSPPIGPGQNWAFLASDPLQTGTAPNVGFSGYVFAVCNFSYAHGFAYIQDNTAAGNTMGYMALVVNNGNEVARPTSLNGEGLEN
jgi:hypothetical protein